MNVKYEVREGGKYIATYDNEKEASDLVDSGVWPVVFGKAYVVKITTEVIYNPKNVKIKGHYTARNYEEQ